MSFIKAQEELRANLVEQIREVTNFAEAEKRGLLAEEVSKIEKIEADIRSAEEAIGVAKRNEERMSAAANAAREFVPASESRSDADILRQIANGEVRSFEFSKRTLVPSDNTVPKSFFDEVFQVARLVGPMLETSQIINTTSGENLTIPTLSAYSTATIKGAGANIDDSEPTFSSITLGAYKYSCLLYTSDAADE